jgi:hypothetical protein
MKYLKFIFFFMLCLIWAIPETTYMFFSDNRGTKIGEYLRKKII